MSTLRAIPAPPGTVDEAVPWHYGDPLAEQRDLVAGVGVVDLGHRDVLEVSGADRLSWLHDLTTAHLLDLAPGQSRLVLILSPHGHVEHELHLVETGRVRAAQRRARHGRGAGRLPGLHALHAARRGGRASGPRGRLGADARAGSLRASRRGWSPATTGSGGSPRRRAATVAGTQPGTRRPAPPGSRAVRCCCRARRRGRPARGAVARPARGRSRRCGSRPPCPGWVRDRPSHAAPRGRLDRGGRPPGQGLLPRPGGRRPGAQPRQAATAAGAGPHRRVRGRPARRTATRSCVGERVVGWVGTAAQHHELGPIATVILKRSADPAADLLIRAADGDVIASQEVVVVP